MGLFKKKKVIKVASSVYNLAGEEKDRPHYLQNLIIRNILSGTKDSVGNTITNGLLNGPGINARRFFNWANTGDNYKIIGMPSGKIKSNIAVDSDLVANAIPHDPDQIVWVQEASLGDSDFSLWAEQYIIHNRPDQLDTEWEVDFDDATNTVTITFVDTTTVSFVASNYDNNGYYLYAHYTISTLGGPEPFEYGDLIHLVPGASFPDVTGYTLLSSTTTPRTETLHKTTTVVSTYSDGRPDESSSTTTTTTPTVNRVENIYEDYVTINSDTSDEKITEHLIRNLFTDKHVISTTTSSSTSEDVGGGVTKTTITWITEETLEDYNSYRDDTQQYTNIVWEPLELWIYKLGSGNADLDALLQDAVDYGKFYPIIPMRINNKFVEELEGYEAIFALAKKAFRKATSGGKYTKVIDQLKTSDDLKDMDYIYVIFGVPLNVIDNAARKYLYLFFQTLMQDTDNNNSSIQYLEDIAAYNAAYEIWLEWRANGEIGTAPTLPVFPTLPYNSIEIQNVFTEDETLRINYHIRINWNYIFEQDNTGIGKSGAKKGDIWLETRPAISTTSPIYTGEGQYDPEGVWTGVVAGADTSLEPLRITWQYAEDKYKYLEVAGLTHQNIIYSGKKVTITSKEALLDADESGLIIPLHNGIFREMRLVDGTQMMTASNFLLINCYQVKKKKWYQSGIFKIIFVVVIAIISVAFTGGAGLGLLGTALSVGTALGLTGVTAAIAGSIANALAALVLTTIVGKLTKNLGIIGVIINAVINIALTAGFGNLNAGLGFTINFSDLMNVTNILNLINAAGQGYQAYVTGQIEDIQKDLATLQDQTNAELKKVQEAYMANLGYSGGQIDPMMYIGKSPVIAESRDTFLTRTLMTGSEVADMTNEMLNSYTELTLTLPNAFT